MLVVIVVPIRPLLQECQQQLVLTDSGHTIIAGFASKLQYQNDYKNGKFFALLGKV